MNRVFETAECPVCPCPVCLINGLTSPVCHGCPVCLVNGLITCPVCPVMFYGDPGACTFVPVSMLIGQPFPLRCICMSRANILRLKVLELTVNIISLAHSSATSKPYYYYAKINKQ